MNKKEALEKGEVIRVLEGKTGVVRIIAPYIEETTDKKTEDIYTFLAKLIIKDREMTRKKATV